MNNNCMILLIVLNVCAVAFCSIDYDGWLNIKLEHSLSETGEAAFTERGNVTIQSLRTGSFSESQAILTSDDKQKLRDLAAKDKLYRLKAIITNSDASQTSFLTSTKACLLAESGLSDTLLVSLDHAGSVIGVTLFANTPSTCQGSTASIDEFSKFNTQVFVRHVESGPIPDTASYIQKLEREKEAKERGEVKDNRSFLAKYWMYIVPVVIIMVLSSASPDAAAGAR